MAFPVTIAQTSSPTKPVAVPVDNRHARPAMRVNKGNITFWPVSEKQQDLTKPQIGNGRVVDSQLWPATVVTDDDDCTATLIGPRVLLTAAHCVGDGAKVTIAFKEDGKRYEGTCARSTNWSPDQPSGDWALCRMAGPVSRNNMAYERLNLDAKNVANGQELTVAGYGCTDIERRHPENPPLLRTGKVLVARSPGAEKTWPNWIFTQSARDDKSAFVCPGDSGGATYFMRGEERFVVAVNSAVQAEPGDPNYKVSYLAALSTEEAKQFIDSWLKKTGEKVCGYGPPPVGCRRT